FSAKDQRAEFVACLRAVLENENCVKVLHDCRQDSAALFHQLGITLKNVVDTQVSILLYELLSRAGSVWPNDSNPRAGSTRRREHKKDWLECAVKPCQAAAQSTQGCDEGAYGGRSSVLVAKVSIKVRVN